MPPSGGISFLLAMQGSLWLAGTARIQELLVGESRQAARLVQGPPERPSESRPPISKRWGYDPSAAAMQFPLEITPMTGAPAVQHRAALPAHASAFVLASLLLDHLYGAPAAVRGDADELLKALDRWLLSHDS